MSKLSPQATKVLRLDLADAREAFAAAERDYNAAKTPEAKNKAKKAMSAAAADIESAKAQLPRPKRRE